LLVHAHDRGSWVVLALVHSEYVLHSSYVLAIVLRGNHPTDLDVGLEIVFLSAFRTVSWQIDSTISSWTI
jgi:hypothetical protein